MKIHSKFKYINRGFMKEFKEYIAEVTIKNKTVEKMKKMQTSAEEVEKLLIKVGGAGRVEFKYSKQLFSHLQDFIQTNFYLKELFKTINEDENSKKLLKLPEIKQLKKIDEDFSKLIKKLGSAIGNLQELENLSRELEDYIDQAYDTSNEAIDAINAAANELEERAPRVATKLIEDKYKIDEKV